MLTFWLSELMNRFELKVNFTKKTKKNYKPTLSLSRRLC